MRLQTALITALSFITLAQLCHAADAATEGGREKVAFPEWGFSAEVPKPYQKHTVQRPNGGTECVVIINGEFAYIFRILDLPANTLASTFIEQSIQADTKSAPNGTAKRWELDNRQNELFKGLTRPLVAGFPGVEAVTALLGDAPGVQSIAMVPIRDEMSPVLQAGVIARADLREQAELRTEVLTGFLTFDRTAFVKPPVRNRPKPPATDEAPAKATLGYVLKKGEIELVGEVRSIAADGKSLVMLVNTIRMPQSDPVKLDPARDKDVLLASVPEGLSVGSRITIAGRNKGVGEPIKADYLAVSQL